MIRCRVCEREHETDATTCDCGADLRVDGIAIGADPRFGDADLGGALPDIGDLPDLEADLAAFPDTSLTDDLSIPDAPVDDVPPSPPPVPHAAPEVGRDDDGPTPPPAVPPRHDAPTRGFAVQPSADMGDGRRKEAPARSASAPTETSADPVGTAPVVDPALANSVFADEELPGPDPSRFDRLREGLGRGGAPTTCPSCGREVAGGRRFCSCGQQLVATPPPTEDEAVPTPSKAASLWRRITGTGRGPRGDERSWGQRAKDSGARRGMRYATRMSASTRFGRIGMLLAGGAGLVMVLGPLRQQVRDIPDLFSAPDPAEVAWSASGACDAPADEDEANPWQTRWPALEEPSSEENCPGVFDTITGTFAEPVDIDRITIAIGETSGQNVSVNRGQPVMSPSLLSIEFTHDDRDDTTVSPLQLEDTAAQQEFGVNVDGATGFTITIDDVVGPDEHPWPELEIVQIAQVAFFRD